MLHELGFVIASRIAAVRKYWFFYMVFPALPPVTTVWIISLQQRGQGRALSPEAVGGSQRLVAGAVVAVLVWAAVPQVAIRLAWAKRLGELDYLASLAVRGWVIVVGSVALPVVFGLPAVALVVGVGSALLGTSPALTPFLVPGLLLTSLFGAGIGAGIGMWIPKVELATALGNNVPLLFLAFTPMVFPPSAFPEPVRWLGGAFPLAWAGDLMKIGLYSGSAANAAILTGLVGAAAVTLLGVAVSGVAARRRPVAT
jgi:hypothetical protein